MRACPFAFTPGCLVRDRDTSSRHDAAYHGRFVDALGLGLWNVSLTGVSLWCLQDFGDAADASADITLPIVGVLIAVFSW
jgi:hypothetical protein